MLGGRGLKFHPIRPLPRKWHGGRLEKGNTGSLWDVEQAGGESHQRKGGVREGSAGISAEKNS